MSTEEKLAQLRTISSELTDLNGIMALLGWDQQVNMPEGGAEDRGMQTALIAGIAFDKSTAPELGQLLEDLAADIPDLEADDDLAREVKVAKREYDRITRMPKEKLIEFVMATTAAHQAWVKAKATNDFASFEPHLKHIVALKQEQADLFKPYDHPYDPLLDEYEPGMKTAEVQAIFSAIRPKQVELLKRIAAAEQVDNSFIKQNYPVEKQEMFGRFVSGRFGYDWNHGRIDLAPHPFTTGFGPGDTRFTTRYLDNDGMSALFSTMHETGHALYDQGLNPKYARTSIGQAASLATHESQSRMWENLVGRSKEFWNFGFPIAQMLFPQFLGNISEEQFYRGLNRVEPSLIRVEADEATYNMHIMLRLEIEIGLIEGSMQTKDLPEIWNTKMQEYLGVTPPNDSKGVLQDVHWSGGMIGYFSTYALGNLVASQLWNTMLKQYPNIPDEMASGKFSTILGWLRENVHSKSFRYDPQDLLRRATGETINPDYYLRYLTDKYTEIYHL